MEKQIKTMTELTQYIASIGKKSGEFTEIDLLDIGVKHKNLSGSEKSWKKVAELVGYVGGGEKYRCFTNRKLKKNGELPMRDFDSISEDAQNFEALYREKTQIRDIYNSYRLSLRNEARVEAFKEALLEKITDLTPLQFTTTIDQAKEEYVEAVLMLSDLHLGVNCTNFYNKYNFDIAKTRIKKLADDTIKYCRNLNVKKLNVINLGDMIQGIIHVTSRIQSDMNLIDQILNAAELVSYLLSRLTETKISITYRSCTDNHSRANAALSENIEAENFNKLIDEFVELRCKESHIQFAHDNIDESIGKFYLNNGKVIMFSHGHLENINKCVDMFEGAVKEFVDYVLLSHFHSSKEKSYNGSKVIVNGSIVGTEEYALSKRLFSPAEQRLLVFDTDNMLNININLQ